MPQRIWELHAQRLNGAIRTTPDGEADVAGLHLSEKAYLLVVRDYRPAELVRLVEREGPAAVATKLCARYDGVEHGRGLVVARGMNTQPLLVREDEAPAPVAARRI